jgi:hypothetical protein
LDHNLKQSFYIFDLSSHGIVNALTKAKVLIHQIRKFCAERQNKPNAAPLTLLDDLHPFISLANMLTVAIFSYDLINLSCKPYLDFLIEFGPTILVLLKIFDIPKAGLRFRPVYTKSA